MSTSSIRTFRCAIVADILSLHELASIRFSLGVPSQRNATTLFGRGRLFGELAEREVSQSEQVEVPESASLRRVRFDIATNIIDPPTNYARRRPDDVMDDGTRSLEFRYSQIV